jgi:glycosyltransferase involved in cell wall biosynthesis
MPISVIIPAYNAERWIADLVRLVLAQENCGELELIVVDDGSNDGTASIVGGIDDTRVRLIRQSNFGQSAAINRGVRESRGDFIKIVDADDWINPGHLESQLRSLEGTDDVVSCCSWGYFREDPGSAARRVEHADRDYEDPLEWLVDSLTMDEGMMGGCRWLIPRRVWDRCGGYDERLSLNNDFDFSIRLLLASSGVRFAKGAVYAYRKGTTGALSGTTSRAAMQSAYWTTESGCQAMLERENSERIRRICANRWQEWLFKFYPEHPDLAGRAEGEVRRLGGSSVRMSGGGIQALLTPLIGWKGVRRLQSLVYHNGWQHVLRWKAARRLKTIARP